MVVTIATRIPFGPASARDKALFILASQTSKNHTPRGERNEEK
jgi:hypothetical protein